MAGNGKTFIVTGATKTGTSIFDVNPGALDHFVISTISSPQTAGTAITGITLTAQDANNNTVTSFSGGGNTVTYSGTAGITGTSAAFSSGVLSGVSVTPTLAGSGKTFIVTGSTMTGTSTFDVNVGTQTKLVITLPGETFTAGSGNSGTVTAQTAGTSFNIVSITATDAYFNIVTSYSGAKTIAYSGPGSGLNTPSYTTAVSFTNGQSTTILSTTLTKAETTTLTATDGGSYGNASSSLIVNPGALDHFAISTISSPQTAGTAITGITLTAKDANNNTVTSFSGGGNTVTYSGTAGITGTSSAFTAGQLTGVSVTPTVAGSSLTFIVTASTKTGTSTFDVNPGVFDHFAISTISSPQTAGTAITGITLTAQDANNNTVTSFSGGGNHGHCYSGTAGITGTSAAFTAGQLTGVSVTPTVAGSGKTFIVTGATKTGTSTFDVNPGTLDHFTISTITSPQTAGTAITGITLTAQDANNNTVTSFSGGGNTVTYSGTAGITGTSSAFTAGQLTGVSVTPITAGSSKTFIVTGATKTGTSTFDVNPGTLDHFALLLSTPQCNANVFGSTNILTAQDANNNTVIAFNASSDNVTITANSPLSGTISGLSGGNKLSNGSDFVSGIANLTSLNLTYTGNSGTGTFTATSGSGKTGTSGNVTVNATGKWLGNTSTDWNDATNWCGGIPTATTDVDIPSGGNQPNIGSAGGSCRNITIESGASLTMGGAYNLNVYGNWTNNGGTFTAATGTVTFKSTSTGKTIAGTLTGTSKFYNITFNGIGGAWSFTNDAEVANNFTITAGSVTAPGNLTVNGSWHNNGTFTHNSGTVNLNGSGSQTINGTFSTTFNNLTLNNPAGATLSQSQTINGTLTLTSGTMTVGAYTLTIAGNSPVRTSGTIDVSNASSTLAFTNSSAITLPASIFSTAVNNMTINGAGGVTASSDFTVNGILNLQSANPSTTKGSLDMWDGSAMKTLTMGSKGSSPVVPATTIGAGDVTGIVTRTNFLPNVQYSFGNQYSTLSFQNTGTLPTSVSVKITIGTAPGWKTDAIQRIYELIQSGASGSYATLNAHYLSSELNGNAENMLVFWVDNPTAEPGQVVEFGRSNYNLLNKWVGISGILVSLFPSSFGQTFETLGNSLLSSVTWNGSFSTEWGDPQNWTPNGVPSSSTIVIIPSTINKPTLTADQSVPIEKMIIENGGILNAATGSTITISGASDAWSNNEGGVFNASTGTVIFTNATATISGITDFYNVTINSGASLLMGANTIMRIGGTMTNNGIWQTVDGEPITVEYNGGDQTVLTPNGSVQGYDDLILSGTGAKTLSGIPMQIVGNFSMSGSATATPTVALTVTGNTTLSGTSILTLGANNILSDAGAVILNGGTLKTGTTTGFSETVGTLNLSDNSTIALGTGIHSLTFAASNGISWTSGKMLTITGWTGGYDGTSGTAGADICWVGCKWVNHWAIGPDQVL